MKIFLNTKTTESIESLEEDFHLVFNYEGEKFIGYRTSQIINDLLQQLSSSEADKTRGKITLVFYQENQQIDLSVLGLLSLIQHTFREIKLVLDVSEMEKQVSHPMLFKLRQYVAMAYLFCSRVEFIIQTSSGEITYARLPSRSNWLTISEKFLPLVLINKEQIDFLFLQNGQILKERNSLSAFNKGKTVEQIFRQHLERGPSSMKSYIEHVYINAVSIMRLISFLSEEDGKKEGRYWRDIEGNPVKDYAEPFRILHENLKEKPLFFILLFSTFVMDVIPRYTMRAAANKLSYSGLMEKIREVYAITYTIFSGLKEIVTNIAEHTTEKKGIIIARLFEGKELEAFKKEVFPEFITYLLKREYQLSNEYFIDLTVFDLSKTGVVETYNTVTADRQKSQLEKITGGEDFKSSSTDAISSLQKNSLHQFFQFPDSEKDHQIYRTIANVGLLIFKRNVDLLKGFFYVSSVKKDGLECYHNQAGLEPRSGFYTRGTFYNIVLPVFYRNTPLQEDHVQILNNEGIFDDNSDINILDFCFVHFNAVASSEYRGYLIEVVLDEEDNSAVDKYTLEENYVSQILHGKRMVPKEQYIPVLVVKDKKILNEGALIRILARLICTAHIRDVIVMGADTELVLSLYRVLQAYNAIFWGEQMSVLFYAGYIQYRYQIPLLLFGNSYDQCRALNYQVFNIEIDPESQFEKSTLPDCSHSQLFTRSKLGNIHLREFDILIQQEGNDTIFETFAKECLQKEID